MCYLQSGEGCLSVDNDHKGYVYRPYKIRVKAYDFLTNKEIEIIARGYDAIVLQHEIDHLSGVLYYDHIDKKNPFKILDNSIAL
jgi:peptide deformylase